MSLASIVCVPICILGVLYTPASSSAAVLGGDLDLGSVSAPVSQGQGGQSTGSASKAEKKAQVWRASWLARLADGRGFSQNPQIGTRVWFRRADRAGPGTPVGGYFPDRRIFGHGGGGILPPVSPEPISRFLP